MLEHIDFLRGFLISVVCFYALFALYCLIYILIDSIKNNKK